MSIWQCLIANKEVINMLLQAIMALAGCLVVVSLWFHRKAVLLQRDGIQASMFSDISGRISALIGETPSETEEEHKIENWYVRLYNEFESILFMEKNGSLSSEMKDYYKDGMIGYVDDLKEEFPSIYKKLAKRLSENDLIYLKKYYKSIKGEAPF